MAKNKTITASGDDNVGVMVPPDVLEVVETTALDERKGETLFTSARFRRGDMLVNHQPPLLQAHYEILSVQFGHLGVSVKSLQADFEVARMFPPERRAAYDPNLSWYSYQLLSKVATIREQEAILADEDGTYTQGQPWTVDGMRVAVRSHLRSLSADEDKPLKTSSGFLLNGTKVRGERFGNRITLNIEDQVVGVPKVQSNDDGSVTITLMIAGQERKAS